jgi:murein DD-endopeptidase MepM/ murein hydrolase activator NlpD
MTEVVADAVTRQARRGVRRVVIAVASVVTLCLACTGGVTIMLLGGLIGQQEPPAVDLGCGNGRAVDPNGALPKVAGLTEEQVRYAAIIIKAGQDLKVPPRGWVVGVATALQESFLMNLPHLGAQNDHDSLGLFQQRPSTGWGTPSQLADPAYQARKFFERLVGIPNWQGLPLTVVAQRVQISAYPSAYAKHEPLASRVVDALTGGGSRAVGGQVAQRCASAGEVAASGWTVPVHGELTSGFRIPSRPGHNGVDIKVPKGTPVRAAAAGVVLVAMCNASVSGVGYSCDRDGGIWVSGCGWYVDILHAGKVITRYCHMRSRPLVTAGQYVTAGQVIGLSGTSGNSTGPHVHFEVHLHGDASRVGAVDPVPFMNQAGAPLVGPV